jgi:hypothetical protein
LFFILNAHFEPQPVKLPPLDPGCGWHRAIDTSLPSGEDFAEPGREIPVKPPDHYIFKVEARVGFFFCEQKAARARGEPP